MPSPRPMMSMMPDAARVLVSGVMCDSRNRPNDITAVPITGNTLYRPVRLMSWPDEIDVRSMPPIIGSISSPDLVGDAPFATCRYTGMYVTDPNSAKPVSYTHLRAHETP